MPRNYFTDEQIEVLKNNKYVEKVTRASVLFSQEFKNEFYRLYTGGISPTKVFTLLGIDYKILGEDRVTGLVRRLRNNSTRPEGFGRKVNSSKGKPRRKKELSFENEKERADYYKEYAARLEQELDLLKKVRALEERHRHPSRVKSSK